MSRKASTSRLKTGPIGASPRNRSRRSASITHAEQQTCEARDPKGLYAKAGAGLVEGFTGINDLYEAPANPDIAINNVDRRTLFDADRHPNVLDSRDYEGSTCC